MTYVNEVDGMKLGGKNASVVINGSVSGHNHGPHTCGVRGESRNRVPVSVTSAFDVTAEILSDAPPRAHASDLSETSSGQAHEQQMIRLRQLLFAHSFLQKAVDHQTLSVQKHLPSKWLWLIGSSTVDPLWRWTGVFGSRTFDPLSKWTSVFCIRSRDPLSQRICTVLCIIR